MSSARIDSLRESFYDQLVKNGRMWSPLQIVAMLTMLIDHIGYVYFPEETLFRIVGRIAYPLYVFGIVLGYRYTSNIKRYIARLFVLALVSQLPFMFVFETPALNVIFTLMFSLLTLIALDRIDDRVGKSAVVLTAVVATLLVPMDYGGYGIVLILIYRYARSKRMVVYHLILNGVYCYLTDSYIQMFSVIPTVAIAYFPVLLQRWRRSVPAWIWRSFYPAHLIALGILLFIDRNRIVL